MKLQKTRVPSNLSKFGILRVLGLPRNARWKDAADLLKYRIVRARAEGNEKEAAIWSEAKAVLKRNLKRDCLKCGCAIHPDARHCHLHSQPVNYRRRAKAKSPMRDKFLTIDWNSVAVESRFQVNPVSLIARKFGMSLPYLRVLFFRQYGKPLAKWLAERRKIWLSDNIHKLSRAELMEGSGLGCEQSFYRVFTRDFGMPPMAYMQGGYAKAA